MFPIKSSSSFVFNTRNTRFSTLNGSTLIALSTLTTTTINSNTVGINNLSYSTISGSTINIASLNTNTIIYSTISVSSLNASTLQVSTLGLGSTFLTTNGSNAGTVSNVSQYPLDISGTLRSVAFQYQDDTISITKQTALDYTTFGQTWVQSIAPSTAWKSIFMSANGQYQVACVNGGALWYSSTYGKAWTASTTSGTTAVAWSAIACSASGQYAVACITSGAIWYSSTYGQTWIVSSASSLAWSAIEISASGQHAVACVNGGSLWYSSNYGQTWTASTTSGTTAAWSSIAISASGQNAVACITAGSIWYSSTYGQTWTNASVTSSNWNSIKMTSSGQYQIVSTSSASQVYVSSNYGQTWSALTTPFTGTLIALSSTGQYMSICVNGGFIYTSVTATPSVFNSETISVGEIVNTTSVSYNDGSNELTGEPALDYCTFGQNWANTNTSATSMIGCAMSANGQYQIACAYNTFMYYSLNYGQTWALGATLSGYTWIACAMSASGQYCIGTVGEASGLIYTSSNYGVTWTSTGRATSYQTRCAISGSGQYMLACGGIGGGSSPIYISSNYGTTWTTVGPTLTWMSCTMSTSGQYMYAGTSGTNAVYVSSNYGQTWTPVVVHSSATTSFSITCSASGQYACTTEMSVYAYYSSNYGQTWTRATSSATPFGGMAMSASGQYVIAGGVTANNQSLYYSTNYGQNWTIVPSSPIGNWFACAISANGQYLLAASLNATYLQQSITRSPSIYASNALVNFPSSSYTIGTSGCTTLPGNIIVQWGFYTISNSTTVGPYTVTFPKVFPSACFNVIVTMHDVGVGTAYAQYIPMAFTYTTSSYTLYIKSLQNSPSLLSNASTVYWQAYGN